MESKILCILIDADKDDHGIFQIALDGMKNKPVKCHYFSDCSEADRYLKAAVDIPKYIFVDIYHPNSAENYCLQNIMDWKIYVTSIISYSAFVSGTQQKELTAAGVKYFLAKTVSIPDLTGQLTELIV